MTARRILDKWFHTIRVDGTDIVFYENRETDYHKRESADFEVFRIKTDADTNTLSRTIQFLQAEAVEKHLSQLRAMLGAR